VQDARTGCGETVGGEFVCWNAQWAQLLDQLPRAMSWDRASCAITASGALQCLDLSEPEQTEYHSFSFGETSPPAGTFTAISAGGQHACAIDEARHLECWGHNVSGESTPPLGAFSAVSAASNHSCALRFDDGRAVCWGERAGGEPPDQALVSVSAGESFDCGRTQTGEVLCWGDAAPDVATSVRGASLSVGDREVCVADADGAVHCWGERDADVRDDALAEPVAVVAVGDGHGCALTPLGDARCWGYRERDWVQQASATPTTRAFLYDASIDCEDVYRRCGCRTTEQGGERTLECFEHLVAEARYGSESCNDVRQDWRPFTQLTDQSYTLVALSHTGFLDDGASVDFRCGRVSPGDSPVDLNSLAVAPGSDLPSWDPDLPDCRDR